MTPPTSPVPKEVINELVELKFNRQYSKKLGKKLYVLKESISKQDFDNHRWMFGHTDIGWTVKYPHHLSRVLYIEGVWQLPAE
ncbi:MAG: hypothetical protein ACXAE3_01300 [Candidatus Kariarchaeaceae archaeon]